MAKSKNNRKGKSKKQQQFVKLSPKAYIRKVARKLPIHECRIYDNWREEGKTQVAVVRRRNSGQLIVGFYLVDLWCLGLKDSFFRHDLEPSEYEEMVEHIDSGINQEMGTNFVKCDPQLAFNIIYGAVEYAEDLGFEPAKEFATTEYLLDDVEEIEFMEIEFGKDGKPFYTSGPDDNVQRIINTLNKNVGEGNYEVTLNMESLMGDGFANFDELDNPEFIKDHPYSTRPEAREKIFSLEDDASSAYQFQLVAADILHQTLNGDFEVLNEGYDDALIEKVNAKVMDAFKGAFKGGIDEELEQMFFQLSASVVAQFRNYGDGEFLFEEDYLPFTEIPDFENLMNLPVEERMDQIADFLVRLSPQQADMFLISHATMAESASIVGDKDRELTPEEREEAIQKTFDHLKSNDSIQSMNDDEVKKTITTIIDEYEKATFS